MKIDNIIFENFRPFYGCVSIDLMTTDGENIILIGGKNGYGKTNFLLGVVWCLYGELISNVDDSFKAEITNSYTKFLDDVLNKDKKLEGGKEFSVQLSFTEVSYGDDNKESTIIIKRSYDINTQTEVLTVEAPDDELLLAKNTDEEKQNFINDYLVPIEIARFVFFDAEKISQIADLSVGKQAELMNQTLGNMLGLNVYQNLSDEIKTYIRKLQKDSSTQQTKEEIINFENAIKSCEQKIETKKMSLQEKNKRIKEINIEIEKYEIEINRKGGDNTDIEILHQKRKSLESERNEMQSSFHGMGDNIPLFMLSGLLQETKEYIEIEESDKKNKEAQNSFTEKVDLFIDKLFNKGEMPNPDIKIQQKAFYADKSIKLADCFIDDSDKYKESLAFTHNLDLSKIKSLQAMYVKVQLESNRNFINIITNFSKKKEEYSKLDRKIKKLESISADELTKSFIDKKDTLNNTKDELNKEIGGLETDISRLESENKTSQSRLEKLSQQATVNDKNQEKIELSKSYIDVLGEFIKTEKEEKKDSIKNRLLAELKKLWHKQLIQDARLTILPNDKGMEVELLDSDNKSIDSKSLSKGEQQLYVSALLKSILDNSIHDLPVFIDTPLARLDSEHRDNILQYYYPELSNQVIVFSTNTEITPSKYQEIQQYVAKKYLITNIDKKSSINTGYFS